MDAIDNLIVRACKSKGYERLVSIRRRFYLAGDADDDHILSMLQDVVSEYNLMTDRELRETLTYLNPDHWRYYKELSYTRNLIEHYITLIKFKKVKNFEGFRKSRKFRNLA